MHTEIKKLILFQTTIFILIISFLMFWFISDNYLHYSFVQESFWSLIDAIGVVICVFVGLVCLLQVKKKDNVKYYLLGVGLLSMGVMRGFAAACTEGNESIFIRSIGCLIGSLWLLLVLIGDSAKYFVGNKWLPWLSIFTCVLFFAWTRFFPEIVPVMSYKNSFTSFAVSINILTGLLFTISAFYFFNDFGKTNNFDSYLVGNMGIIIGLSMLMFKFSYTWSASWWFWQLFQFFGYLIGGVLILRWYKDLLVTLANLSSEHENVINQLVKRSELSRLILDTAYDAFISIDENGLIIEWNREAERIFGLPRYEVLGKKMAEIIIPQKYREAEKIFGLPCQEALGKKMAEIIIPQKYREAHNKGFNHYFKISEETVLNERIEISALRRNGEEFPIEITIRPIQLGDAITFNAFIRDITEHKKEVELNSQLAAIVDSSDDAIISTTIDGTIITWNKGAEGIFGYTCSEAKEQSISIITPREYPNELKTINEKIKNGESFFRYETKRKRKDGEIIDVSLTISPIKEQSGEVKKIAITARDITEHKRATKELAEADARYKILADNSSDLISLFKPNNVFIYVSPSYKKLLGFDQEELINRSIYEFCHTEDVDYLCQINPIILNPETQIIKNVTFRQKTKDGNYVWVEAKIKGLLDTKNKAVKQILFVAQIMRQYKSTEEELLKRKSTQNGTSGASTHKQIEITEV